MNILLTGGAGYIGSHTITTPRKEALNEWRAKFGTGPGQPIEEWSSQEDLASLLMSAGFKILLNENLSSKVSRSNESIEIYQTYLAQNDL